MAQQSGNGREPRVLAIDAGGTMTDTFVVDRSGIYSGAAMLNRLLEREGRRIGVIVTGGTEDTLRLERGIQTYLGYPYSSGPTSGPLVLASEYH